MINCTLKPSPQTSNTEALAGAVITALQGYGVEMDIVRAVDPDLKPGVESDMGEGDDWPAVHDKLLASQILVIASPTWLSRPSSVAQRVLERMDAMLRGPDDDNRPVAYNRVAGVLVSGNEDGAHHVISEISSALGDIGYTIPGQAWTYWHLGPGPGPDYLDDDRGRDWSLSTGRALASNLVHTAQALTTSPLPAPPS
ncbi:flavodoxin family protein [Streptomyces chartreusis]